MATKIGKLFSANTLVETGDDDMLIGGLFNDVLVGGAGKDYMDGGLGTRIRSTTQDRARV